MHRRAWNCWLKITAYLRTLVASDIEKSTVCVKEEVCGLAGVEEIIAVAKQREGEALSEPFFNVTWMYGSA